ncbi:MAG: DUF503 domain-containing protein [Dehalococcoidaceae bacterium]|nr:DUF503 domain-containing protein [Dehalococcoidaceae bacterium]
MHVGVIRIYLSLSGNASLKGKRQLIRPIIAQVQNRFNVSIAEIEDQDVWGSAVLGISLVSSDKTVIDERITRLLNFIEGGRFSVRVIETQVEVITV